jgi:N6-L-threonylcarbamoyladenine synthase
MKDAYTVLGIETSCDETALALVRVHQDGHSEVIGEMLSSQIALHQAYGGVVPELASRQHIEALPILFQQLRHRFPDDVDTCSCIGVTQGPGLKGCLLMGINFAKGLSLSLGKSLIGVNHIEGHLYSAFLNKPLPRFPFLALIVSGGHTELVFVEQFGTYQIIARTIDDAAGEAFDKSAHLLGFPYPGGRALSDAAASVESSPHQLPKVMREADGFSFSGLKTAIHLLIKKCPPQSSQERAALCYTIEHAIVDALMYKVKKSLSSYPRCRGLSVVGGVSANRLLRTKMEAFARDHAMELHMPEPQFATDNASMIALAAAYRLQQSSALLDIQQESRGLPVLPRYPIETIS